MESDSTTQNVRLRITMPDHTQYLANTRAQAVQLVKEKLREWMNPEDHIVWDFSEPARKRGDALPNVAIVVTENWERTDDFAIISPDRGPGTV